MASLDTSFREENFEPLQILFTTLPTHFNDEELEAEKNRYQKSLEIIECGLSQKVQSSYTQFLNAINDVQSLSNDLLNCTKICSDTKINLSNSKDHIAKRGVLIANNYRKRHRYKQVHENLIKLRQFMKLRSEMEKATKTGDFNKALSISLANKEIYGVLKDFKCVADMSNTLSGEMSWLKDRLDRAIISMFKTKFDAHSFSSLLETEILMHEPSYIVSRLKGHFKGSIEAGFKRSTITSLLLDNREDISADALENKKFASLCKRLKEYHFPACLNIVFEQLCNYIYCYHKMIEWLKEQCQKEHEGNSVYDDIYQGLLKYKRVVWEQTLQPNILLILDYVNFEEFAFDKCLQILDLVRKFLSIIEDFTAIPAYQLRDRFKMSSDLYFVYFHKRNMESLKDLFEQETWMSIDIPIGYCLENIDIFKNILCEVVPLKRRYKRRQKSLFTAFELQGNPFEFKEGQDFETIDSNDINDEDLDPELLLDSVEEVGQESDSVDTFKTSKHLSVPLLSSVTNKVVKMIGKYISVMKSLDQSTLFVYEGVEQLIKLYLYCIHFTFASPLKDVKYVVKKEVKNILLSVENNLICDTTTTTHGRFTNLRNKIFSMKNRHVYSKPPTPTTPIKRSGSQQGDLSIKQGLSITDIKVQKPKVATISANNLPFQTLVAYESLKFFHEALNDMKLTFMELLPDNNTKVLSTYQYILPHIPEIGTVLLKNMAVATLPKEKLVQNILSVDWNSNRFELEASPYVTTIIKDFEQFNQKFRVLVKVQRISQKTAEVAIQCVILSITEILVSAYSQIKKISDSGRQLLTINSQETKMAIERITGKKGFNWSFLDFFIHALHYPDDDIVSFVQEHSEYTYDHLSGLIEMGSWREETKEKCLKFLTKNKDA